MLRQTIAQKSLLLDFRGIFRKLINIKQRLLKHELCEWLEAVKTNN